MSTRSPAWPSRGSAVYARRGIDTSRCRRSTREAAHWFAHLELGMLEANSRRRRAAIADMERARRQDPRRALAEAVLGRVSHGAGVDPDTIEL